MKDDTIVKTNLTLVDSSSWIESLRKNGDPLTSSRVANLLEIGTAAWCPIVYLELWRGVRPGVEEAALKLLETKLTMLSIHESVWTFSYALMHKARRAGVIAPATDVVIVSTARRHGARIEHRDRHFDLLWELSEES